LDPERGDLNRDPSMPVETKPSEFVLMAMVGAAVVISGKV
jgi:hypothetical protein